MTEQEMAQERVAKKRFARMLAELAVGSLAEQAKRGVTQQNMGEAILRILYIHIDYAAMVDQATAAEAFATEAALANNAEAWTAWAGKAKDCRALAQELKTRRDAAAAVMLALGFDMEFLFASAPTQEAEQVA